MGQLPNQSNSQKCAWNWKCECTIGDPIYIYVYPTKRVVASLSRAVQALEFLRQSWGCGGFCRWSWFMSFAFFSLLLVIGRCLQKPSVLFCSSFQTWIQGGWLRPVLLFVWSPGQSVLCTWAACLPSHMPHLVSWCCVPCVVTLPNWMPIPFMLQWYIYIARLVVKEHTLNIYIWA